MEAAKDAIKDFTSKHGKHDTTVHEHHKPAITHEHASPTTHHEERSAIDREIHQDHYHTSVQPIHDREVLPEKHHHEIHPVKHTEHRHGNHDAIKERLTTEAAQFEDVHETGRVQHTHHTAPVQTAEHVHHHLHETIQPVIQKETIQPTVIHSTKPVHEVHHNEPIHHAATAEPAISMAEFKRQGGSLTGETHRTDHFSGEPHTETPEQHARHAGAGHQTHGVGGIDAARSTTGSAGTTRTQASTLGAGTGTIGEGTRGAQDRLTGNASTDGNRNHLSRDTAIAAGATAGADAGSLSRDRNTNTTNRAAATDGLGHERNAAAAVDPRIDSNASRTTPATHGPSTTTTTSTVTGASSATDPTSRTTGKLDSSSQSQYADTHAGSAMDRTEDRRKTNLPLHTSNAQAANVTRDTVPPNTSTGTAISPKKPSIIDRLNPLKDADGDGKKGIMN